MFNASEIVKGSILVTLRWGYTINAVLQEKERGKKTNILDGTNVFNIDNNQKCFLSSKSVISEGSSDTKTGVMMLKIQNIL